MGIKQNKRGFAGYANPQSQLYLCPSGTALKQSHRTVILMTLHKQCIRDFRVSFRHSQVRMTHLLLEREQIAAVLQPEGSKTVSDLVGGEFGARAFTVPSEVPP